MVFRSMLCHMSVSDHKCPLDTRENASTRLHSLMKSSSSADVLTFDRSVASSYVIVWMFEYSRRWINLMHKCKNDECKIDFVPWHIFDVLQKIYINIYIFFYTVANLWKDNKELSDLTKSKRNMINESIIVLSKNLSKLSEIIRNLACASQNAEFVFPKRIGKSCYKGRRHTRAIVETVSCCQFTWHDVSQYKRFWHRLRNSLWHNHARDSKLTRHKLHLV